MAMARDGLLPSFFSDVNRHTHVPVKSSIVTGICAGSLSFFMEVSQLAGMVIKYFPSFLSQLVIMVALAQLFVLLSV